MSSPSSLWNETRLVRSNTTCFRGVWLVNCSCRGMQVWCGLVRSNEKPIPKEHSAVWLHALIPRRARSRHSTQPGQSVPGACRPAGSSWVISSGRKQPKSLLKTQENRKANLLPEIGNFREQGELSKSANVEGKRHYVKNAKQFHWILI